MDSIFNKYAAIITISISFGGFCVGFINWIDNRYSKSAEFTAITYKIITANYSQQISILNNRLLYLLEFEPKGKIEIQETKKQIKVLISERKEVLNSGHVEYGNHIYLNNEIISKKFNVKD